MSDGNSTSTPSGGAVVMASEDDIELDLVDVHHWIEVVGHGSIVQQKHSIFIGPESVIAHADLDSLREALLVERCCSQLPVSPERIAIALDQDGDFHPDSTPLDNVELLVDTDRVWATAEAMMRREPEWSREELRALLRPAVAPHGCVIDKVEFLVDGADPDAVLEEQADLGVFGTYAADARDALRGMPHYVRVFVRHSGPAKVGALLIAGREVQALLDAFRDGPLNVRTARNLLRAKLPRLLLGLHENEWLEVKSREYQLAASNPVGDRSKIELAQDVARFANGDCDAMLIIGFEETKVGGSSRLGAVRSVPLTNIDPDRYRAVIDARVVPPIEGLSIERLDLGSDKGLLIIYVPRQPSELQPYLVHGAIAADKTEGAFISIVRRRGEGSITTSAEQIHAYIVAGRAYLRGHDVRE